MHLFLYQKIRSKFQSKTIPEKKEEKQMEFVTGRKEQTTYSYTQLFAGDLEGQEVCVRGAIHNIRNMGEIQFVILRRAEGLLQCVEEEDSKAFAKEALKDGDTVEITGILRKEERAPGGYELRVTGVKLLSQPAAPMPLPIAKYRMNTSLEAMLTYRPVSLRNVRERAKFKLQEAVCRAFREYLSREGFTEIHTPKIGAMSAEGGANIFKLEYFGKLAVLQQSPQFYKQTMVGVFDRVFETAPVFRAEKHNTTRHLNEYTSLDFEMGYIDGFEDIMDMETGYLQYLMELLKKDYAKELQILDVTLPKVEQIPQVRFDEAKRLVSEAYDRPMRNPYDLEPEEEMLIGRYFKEHYDSDFVFVTHYPSKKRPFYAMDDPKDPKVTLSFDLLFRGMEITTGGQRIHDYDTIIEKMQARGMDPADAESYLMIFKYGMPPHGGLGIGMERLTMKLIDAANVRETTLFPRDVNRLEP